MFWTAILIVIEALISIFAVLDIIGLIVKPGAIYKNQSEQKNPTEGKNVRFVFDESDKENTDGVRVTLRGCWRKSRKS